MTYEEAKAIALSRNPRVDSCREYVAAYHFYEKNGEEREPDNDVVIFKKTGKIRNFTTFIIDYTPEDKPREIEF